MAKIDTYLKLNGFDEQFRRSEDTEFIVRAALAGAVFVKLGTAGHSIHAKEAKSLEVELHFHKLVASKPSFIDRFSNYEFCIGWLDLKYHFKKRSEGINIANQIFLNFLAPQSLEPCSLSKFANKSQVWGVSWR